MRLSQLSAPADVTRIADLIRAAVRTPGNPLMGAKVTTRFDRLANGWCVRLVLGTRSWDLVQPAPGAMYGLFEGARWIGGIDVRAAEENHPDRAALAMVRRAATRLTA